MAARLTPARARRGTPCLCSRPQLTSPGFDAATLYAYTLLQESVAAHARDAFPVLDSPAGHHAAACG
ncbi:hypothetical protein BM536_006945 [Streptomyces phaeoluteigriseus]|uniref:Uncharacterized protein n=1 Tax=Streptomyces phaeoluteigriseus TaxID=114686 RepID=A0A1V6MWK5_9ACTN|nr:hypothetical protein BM536_006945 [Streptomyces phaeoluteigriseus]